MLAFLKRGIISL